MSRGTCHCLFRLLLWLLFWVSISGGNYARRGRCVVCCRGLDEGKMRDGGYGGWGSESCFIGNT